VLANCPFHALAAEHTELVCTMNAELVREVVEATGEQRRAVLDPSPSRCCVVLEPPR
jgi:predicted ArsR family transcriptional regulator